MGFEDSFAFGFLYGLGCVLVCERLLFFLRLEEGYIGLSAR